MADRDRSGASVLVHLTGAHRGTRQHLDSGSVRVGTAEDAQVHFPAGERGVASRHATLIREAGHYVLWSEPGQAVFVNGEQIEQQRLLAGDLVRIGHGGPVLRYREQDRPPGEYKTMAQALLDCVDCANAGSERISGRLGLLLAGLPRELLTRTAPAVRIAAISLVILLAGAVVALAAYAVRLEHRLDEEIRRVATIEAALRAATLDRQEQQVRDLLTDLQTGLTERIEALESRSDAGRRVIADASGSVLLLQGAYRFNDPATGEPLRVRLGPDGSPIRAPWGGAMVAPGAEGPPFERFFTGSAFLVLGGLPRDARLHTSLLVTNRHLVRPWEFDPAARQLVDQGYEPTLELVGFLPGVVDPVDIEVVAVSDEADVAVLFAPDAAGRAMPLPLGESSPDPGDQVIVLGYPTGFAALLARSEAAFVDSLVHSEEPDFWEVARRLSAAGLVRPLATGGIVGQVTRSSVVYDAETTRGGSGGPVLDLDGRVVAITVGVMQGFGGSNLGVPVTKARRLLERVARGGTRTEAEAGRRPTTDTGTVPDRPVDGPSADEAPAPEEPPDRR